MHCDAAFTTASLSNLGRIIFWVYITCQAPFPRPSPIQAAGWICSFDTPELPM